MLLAVMVINWHVLMINLENLSNHTSGPLLESKAMHMIFHKTGKKGKQFESFSKNIQSLKIF